MNIKQYRRGDGIIFEALEGSDQDKRFALDPAFEALEPETETAKAEAPAPKAGRPPKAKEKK